MRIWELGTGQFMVASALSDLAVHHHPAVQVAVGLAGPLSVTAGDGAQQSCRLVVVASGTRHAVRPDARSAALMLYLAPQTRQGAALNIVSRSNGQHSGIWIVEDGEQLADAAATAFGAGDARAASEFLIGELCKTGHSVSDQQPSSVHPQLAQAIDLVSHRAPADVDLRSIARAVALSPDYLGRLCKEQTGVSFSATTRWVRLQAGVRYLADGMAVTDAAHLAGFADGSHANRVCWEMTGAGPSDFARALQDPTIVSPRAG